jgi:citrate/tricarballylate utilization protein
VRVQTYADYAWPPALGALYQRQGLMISLALAAALAFFLVLAVGVNGTLWNAPLAGNFYAIFPHNLMVLMFAPIFLFAVLALSLGVSRFWCDVSPATASNALGEAAIEATSAALRLKYLDGANQASAYQPIEGCPNGDDAPTLWRRRFHHLTFYGFMLCFASTSVATLYHYLFNWQAPYGYTSLPVILGTVGGIGLLIGPAGLLWLNLRRHASHGDAAQKPMDRGFIALLFLISLTGLALLVWRDSAAMAVLLAVHLGTVMALFVTLPYGKFAHGIFRSAALLKFTIEKRQPTQLALPEA